MGVVVWCMVVVQGLVESMTDMLMLTQVEVGSRCIVKHILQFGVWGLSMGNAEEHVVWVESGTMCVG